MFALFNRSAIVIFDYKMTGGIESGKCVLSADIQSY
jgi:hypothetical protein